MLRAQLPPELVQEFLDLCATAAPMRAAVTPAAKERSAKLQLAYDAPTRLLAGACAPLPYGCALIPNCFDIATKTHVGNAVEIPIEWPLQITPSKICSASKRRRN